MRETDLRSECYKCGRALGDVHAVSRSLQTGSITPLCKRCARRYVYRRTFRLLRMLTK